MADTVQIKLDELGEYLDREGLVIVSASWPAGVPAPVVVLAPRPASQPVDGD